ncbi:MAG: hypothetical protein ONB49_18795, partial [candidate division KSB1 bacterium]|nr:hypothetical protein [candidate division KSB1 bacterium]
RLDGLDEAGGAELFASLLSAERRGLAPAGPGGSFYHPYPLATATLGSANTLEVVRGDTILRRGALQDFYPHRFSGSGEVRGEVVFAGFGITARDNATMGLDFEMRPRHGWRLYGEWFVDDFSVARLGSNWYGNKVAWLLGMHATNPLGLPRSDWRVEYVRIAPYVYSHTFPINVYKNYGTLLGHPAGPNADWLLAEWLFWGSRRWHLQFSAEHQRHGANPVDRNVGGDVDRPFHVTDSQRVRFLDGIVERRLTLRLQAGYELLRNLRLQAALQTMRGQNAPASGGRRQVRTHSLFLALGWNADE